MSNIIYLYGHFEEKLPVDSSGCLGVASGYMMPILWAALFTLDNLIIEKIPEADGEIWEVDYLITTREKAVLNLNSRVDILKEALPQRCHCYVDDWIKCFDKELECKFVVLNLDEFVAIDLMQELELYLSFTNKNFESLIERFKKQETRN
jgi:hypothetical protein